MKVNLLFVTLLMIFASPMVSARTEIEILRSKSLEQERQIQQLELENSRLRNDPPTKLSTSPPAKPAEGVTPASPAASLGTYTVKPGDSLARIAKKIGISQKSLARQNGLKTTAIIHPGQKLKFQKSGTSTATAPRVASTSSQKANTYTIKNGETFYSISRNQKTTVAKLIAANPTVKPTALRTGQVINLGTSRNVPTQQLAASTRQTPVASLATAPTKSVLQTKRPQTRAAVTEPAPQPESTPIKAPVSEVEKKIHPVTIDGEMTYGDFAEKHGTDILRLNSLNGLDLNNSTVLAKGSELYVPGLQP